MPYLPTQDRNQLMFCSLDSFVAADSIARIIDAFVRSLNMDALGFTKAVAAVEGRPSFDPRLLLALLIYGYRKAIRSSRKLHEACKTNIEVKWLMGGLEPDFRTISDFRKDNVDSLKAVFREFNKRLAASSIKLGFVSVDGSKFLASNAKDANFTAHKLDDRIEWLTQHSDEYLRILEDADNMDESEADGQFSREELEEKLAQTQERLERYKAYRQYMEDNNLTQLSITDADARLMKSKNGFVVAYNAQTAVDSESHLILDYQMTNQATDHGLLESTVSPMKEDGTILDAVADKGYNKEDDMIQCLENGIVPHVILPDGQDSYELELAHHEADVDLSSTKAEDLSKAIHAGKIPEAYQDVITSATVVEKRKWVSDEAPEISAPASPYGTEEEMKAHAAEGYFVRDPERNVVYCPAQEVLHQKSIKRNGNIRYANKTACRRCPYRNRCFKSQGEWKEIDFSKDCLVKPNKEWLKSQTPSQTSPPQRRKRAKGHFENVRVVVLTLKPKRVLMDKRKCISEHPFGTIKRSMDSAYFLLRSMEKVAGEFALFCLGYNLRRAANLLGFEGLMAAMA